jgi:spore coat polysaccharide biosynthesis protein SpsF
MKVAAIVQARCGSTRFPNKVFVNLCGKPLIWHVFNRLKFAKRIDQVVLATTTSHKDDQLERWANENGVTVFRGSEDDVLSRYYNANEIVKADVVVRITADDPFKEPSVIDRAIEMLLNDHCDFVSNNNPPTFPEGLDCEVMTAAALRRSQESTEDAYEREHVTQYIYHNPHLFKTENLFQVENMSQLRWTIDTDIDFQMVKIIYEALYNGDLDIFHMDEILEYLKEHPEVQEMNNHVARSAMYK